jgi:hypothetical protein
MTFGLARPGLSQAGKPTLRAHAPDWLLVAAPQPETSDSAAYGWLI